MAKKPSTRKKVPTKAETKKLKDDLLKKYCKLRMKDPNKVVLRSDFCLQTKTTEHQIRKLFGSFGSFSEEASRAFKASLPPAQRALLSERNKKFDPDATKEDCIDDLRKLQEKDPLKFPTRNYYRENGSYSDSTWNQYFGTFQEFKRQAGLELTRHQQKIEVSIARQASIDHYREYYSSNVLPYYDKYLKASKNKSHIKKILAMSDLHDEECCEFALSVFIDTCSKMQPDVIVMNGDIYDLIEFGRYSVDPRQYGIKRRFDFIKNRVFAPLRKVCPNAQIDLIAGNHEMRLLKLLADATPNVRILLSDVMNIGFSEIFGLDEFQINWASKFDLAAYTKQDMKNEEKKNYRIYYDLFVFSHHPDSRLLTLSGSNGHHHQGKITPHSFVDPNTALVKKLTWSQTPGMHEADAEYLNNVPGWNKGFLEVTVNLREQETVQKIHYTHDDWAEINGVYYERKK